MTFRNTNRNTRRNASFKKERSNPIIAIAILVGFIAVLALVSVAFGKELVNTATNEIATPQNMALRDVLEDIYSELNQDTESTFIVVDNEDGSVGLFTIDYPYEDYLDTDHKVKEVAQYDSVMDLYEELN